MRLHLIHEALNQSDDRYQDLILKLDNLSQAYQIFRHDKLTTDQILSFWNQQFGTISNKQDNWVTKKKIIGALLKHLPSYAYGILDWGSWGSSPMHTTKNSSDGPSITTGKISNTWKYATGSNAAKARFGPDRD